LSDDIRKLDDEIDKLTGSIERLTLELRYVEDKIIRQVNDERNLNRRDPSLSNVQMREIAVREKLILDPEHTELFEVKSMAEAELRELTSKVKELRRNFIREHKTFTAAI
jgi:predicted  nucleic acid-binding Zn-ribbon protein